MSDFNRYDSIFGTYSRYGSTEPHPSIGGTNVMQSSNFIANIGKVLLSEGTLKRRGCSNHGIDFMHLLLEVM